MSGQGDRLQRAIRRRDYTSSADFARAMGMKVETLRAHIHRDSIPKGMAPRYAAKLRIPMEWLLYNKGQDPFGPGLAEEARSYTPPGFGTLKGESAIALEVMDTVTKLLGLDLTREKQGQLLEDSLDLVRKYKT